MKEKTIKMRQKELEKNKNQGGWKEIRKCQGRKEGSKLRKVER